jgi:diketogulonate reductase-like aldo/keto reductase
MVESPIAPRIPPGYDGAASRDRTRRPERIAENIDVVGFELDSGDMAAIDELDAGARIGPDPDTFVRP